VRTIRKCYKNEAALRQLETRFNSDTTPDNVLQYIKEIDSITDWDSTLFEAIERVTWVNYWTYAQTARSLQKTPTYRVMSRTAALFPDWKSVTTTTKFTEAEVDSIIEKSKPTKYNFDKETHFIKDWDTYTLNVENLWPSVGIEKLSFSDGDIEFISKSEWDFIDTLSKINEVSWKPVYNIQKIQSSWAFNNITWFLSKILC